MSAGSHVQKVLKALLVCQVSARQAPLAIESRCVKISPMVKSVDRSITEQNNTSLADIGPILAIVPAYNEDRFIGSVVLKARAFVDQVIVVDDGSTDETAIIA